MESLVAYESDRDDSEANGEPGSTDSTFSDKDSGIEGFLLAENEGTSGLEKEGELNGGKQKNSLPHGPGPSQLRTSQEEPFLEQEEVHSAKRTRLADVCEQPCKLRLPPPFSTSLSCSLTNPILLPSVVKPTAKRKDRTRDGGNTKDDTGRIRTFPHVEGNFAVHVYIPVGIPGALGERLGKVLEIAATSVGGLRPMASEDEQPADDTCRFPVPRECHVSLSRATAVRFEQIGPLVDALRRKLRGHKPFPVEFARWECFVNEERTRSFLSLEVVAAGLHEISRQVKLVDEAFFLYRLPLFYDPPRPHISLGWLLGDHEGHLRSMADELNEASGLESTPGRTGGGIKSVFRWEFGKVICKIGQREYIVCDTALRAR